MATVKDSAVCLRLMDWSETSQIVVLMTEQHGKVSAVAKGAKRQQPSTLAKFSGGVELLSAGEAVFITKRGSELANLIEWDLHDAHWHLRKNFRAYNLAMYAADLVHHLVQDHDAHPGVYAALRGFLKELGSAKPQAADGKAEALLRFQWALVDELGYRPVLDRDVQTGAPLDEAAETLGFSAVQGGVVADTGASDRWRVRRGTVEVLRQVAEGNTAQGPSLNGEAVERANKLLCAYFRAILDQQLPTMAYVLGDG
jgi:DNA repair protein RecO (recombination protein O)